MERHNRVAEIARHRTIYAAHTSAESCRTFDTFLRIRRFSPLYYDEIVCGFTIKPIKWSVEAKPAESMGALPGGGSALPGPLGSAYGGHMQPGNQFGEFLRARRELLTPEDVGLPATGRRRVQGLRREEAALVSGLSPEDYLRLEQGVEQNPTDDVLDALTRALKLDDDAAASLRNLARPTPLANRESTSAEASHGEAPEGLVGLIDTWPNQAAWIEGRLTEVLAANPLARALSPLLAPGTNLMRSVFLDPAARELYTRWDEMLVATVARLRTLIGPDIDDPALAQLVGELSVRSGEFRALWGAAELPTEGDTITRLTHPQVGALELETERLAIGSPGEASFGQFLVILHAQAGSDSETALRRLSAIASGKSPAEAKRILPAPVPIESKRRLP